MSEVTYISRPRFKPQKIVMKLKILLEFNANNQGKGKYLYYWRVFHTRTNFLGRRCKYWLQSQHSTNLNTEILIVC